MSPDTERTECQVVDLSGESLIKPVSPRFPVMMACFSANGRHWAAACGEVTDYPIGEGHVFLSDTQTGETTAISLPSGQMGHHVAFSRDGNLLAIGTTGQDEGTDQEAHGTFRMWNVPHATWQEGSFEGKGWCANGWITNDGKHLIGVFGTLSGATLRRWSLDSGETEAETVVDESLYGKCRISVDQQVVAGVTSSSQNDRTVRLWNAKDLKEIGSVPVGRRDVMDFEIAGDSREVIVAYADGGIDIHAMRSVKVPRRRLSHSDRINDLEIDSQGKLFATASDDHTARIWNLNGEQTLHFSLQHPQGVGFIRFDRHGQQLVTVCRGDKGSVVRVWSVEKGSLIGKPRHVPWQLTDAVHAEKQFRFAGHLGVNKVRGRVKVWNVPAGTSQFQVLNHNHDKDTAILDFASQLRYGSFSPDGARVALATNEAAGLEIVPFGFRIGDFGAIHLFDTHTGHRLHPPLRSTGVVDRVAFDLNANSVYGVCDLGIAHETHVDRWTLADGRRKARIKRPSDDQTGQGYAVLSPMCRHVFFGYAESPDGVGLSRAALMSLSPPKEVSHVHRLDEHQPASQLNLMSPATYSHNGGRVAAQANVSDVLLWDVGNATPKKLSFPHSTTALALSPNDQVLATAMNVRDRGHVQLIDLRTQQPVGRTIRLAQPVNLLRFSPDGNYLVTVAGNGARLWTAHSISTKDWGIPASPPFEHEGTIVSAEFDSSSQYLVTSSKDKTARLWELETGLPIAPPLWHEDEVVHATFSSDAARLLTVTSQSARVWSIVPGSYDTYGIVDLAKTVSLLVIDENMGAVPDWSAHLDLWKKMRKRHPEFFEISPKRASSWHRSRANCLEARERWPEARFHFEQLAQLDPNDLQTSLRLIRCQHSHGLSQVEKEHEGEQWSAQKKPVHEQAYRAYKKLLADKSLGQADAESHSDILLNLTTLALTLGKVEAAREHVDSMKVDDNWWLQLVRGHLYQDCASALFDRRKLAEAEDCATSAVESYTACLRTEPNFLPAIRGLGIALDFLAACEKDQGRSADQIQKHSDDARDNLNKYLSRRTDELAQSFLLNSYSRTNQWKELIKSAREAAQKAVAEESGSGGSYLSLQANAHCELGEWREAIEIYESLSKIESIPIVSFCQDHALACLAGKDSERYEAVCERALERVESVPADERDRFVVYLLVRACTFGALSDAALAKAASLIETQKPVEAWQQAIAGAVALRQGDHRRAAGVLKTAIKKHGHNVTLEMHAFLALAHAPYNIDEAKKSFKWIDDWQTNPKKSSVIWQHRVLIKRLWAEARDEIGKR